jgi:glycosyltransferase involved in cell wall biosynthesis
MLMMRVLYVTDSLMAGGIESLLVGLVTKLDSTRFEPSILCLYGPTARPLHFAPQVRAADIPLYTPDLGWSAWDKLKAIASIVSTARAVRPHIVQAEGYHANLLARLAWPFLPSTILIGSVRGTHTAKQLLYERLSHWACAQLVVNAPHLKTMLVTRAHVPEKKVLHIPNGIDIGHFAHPHDNTLRQQIAPGIHRVFVSIGRISFEKSLHRTVEGFGLLKRRGELPSSVRLVIAGPIQEPEAQQALEAAIHRDGLEERVIQHPATAHPEDYYHACDVCLVYSPERTPGEGLPSVILEAMAAGRPVLVSEAANAARVVEDKVNGWVVRSNDSAHLAETLRSILALSDEAFAQMRKACLQTVKAYAVELMAQRYMRLYECWQSLRTPHKTVM